MKIKAFGILLGLFMIKYAVGSSVSLGTVVSRKPVIIDKSTPTPTSIQKKPIEVHTTTEETPDSEDQNIPPPTAVKHEENDQQTEPKSTTSDPQVNIDSSADPTDYSTVWPTRWRPRRHLNFGAQGDAGKPLAAPDRLLLSLVVIGAFIGGIIL